MSCGLIDIGCYVDGVIQSLVSIVPFGASGAIFLAGMVTGAALGRWGVAAVIVAAGALKYADREHEQLKPGTGALKYADREHEQLKPGTPDAAPPVPKPKKRKPLF